MATNRLKELQNMVSKLQAERQAHLDAIAEIDAAFVELGLSVPESRSRRRKPGGAKRRKPGPKVGAKRGGRKKKVARKTAKKKATKKKVRKGKGKTGTRYAVSGTKMVTDLVAKAGSKGIAGGAINKKWVGQGRAGSAYNILGQLVADKVIKHLGNI